MADSIELKITGLKELNIQLVELGGKIGDQALSKSLGAGAQTIVAEARRNLHRAEKDYALYLRFHERMKGYVIKVPPGWLAKQVVSKKIKTDKYSAATSVLVKDAFHAFFWIFLEFGTSKMPKMQFMGPAFDSCLEKSIDTFKDRLQENIDKATER